MRSSKCSLHDYKELYMALIGAVEALRATETFMRILDPEAADHLDKLVETFDELLDRFDR